MFFIRMLCKRLAIGPILIVMCPLLCYAQIDDTQARRQADASFRATSLSDGGHFRLLRREDLEDDLFRLGKFGPDNVLRKGAYFFQVQEDGIYIDANGQVFETTTSDGIVKRLIAVSSVSGQAYRLAGFKEGKEEFNRLAIDVGLAIVNDRRAEGLARFFYTTVFDPDHDRMIWYARQLKHKSEDVFFNAFSNEKAERSFSQWWAGFNRVQSAITLGVKTKKEDKGYSAAVTFLTAWSPGKPQLEAYNFEISQDGTCNFQGVGILYPQEISRGSTK